MTKFPAVAAALCGLMLGLCGCGRSAPWSRALGPQPAPSADADDSGYREPPQVRRAERAPDGGVILSGHALPGAAVRLASPDGRHEETTADASGAWSLTAPPGGPALYGLSQEAGGRRDQAEGYLAVLPGAGPVAAELRSGAGAVLLARPTRRPVISAIDFDGANAAVVSGWAGANQPLRVMIDGMMVDEGAAEASGRFFLSLPKSLAPGSRLVQVFSPAGAASASLDVAPAQPFGGVLHAVQHDHGWRLDWVTPAGGVQSTELYPIAETDR